MVASLDQQLLTMKDLPLTPVYVSSASHHQQLVASSSGECSRPPALAIQNNSDAKIEIVLNTEQACGPAELDEDSDLAGTSKDPCQDMKAEDSEVLDDETLDVVPSVMLGEEETAGQRSGHRASSKVILRRGSSLLSPDHAMAENENNLNMVAAR